MASADPPSKVPTVSTRNMRDTSAVNDVDIACIILEFRGLQRDSNLSWLLDIPGATTRLELLLDPTSSLCDVGHGIVGFIEHESIVSGHS